MPPGQATRAAITAARNLRTACGAPLDEPLACVLTLAEHHCGVPVAVLPRLEGDYAGGYFRKRGRAVIVVCADDPAPRMRFTLGHELCHHYFRHLERVAELRGRSGIRDTREDLRRPKDWWEVQANAFAAELLVPGAALERWEQERSGGPIGLDVVVELACRFGVSPTMACYRLKTGGLIGEERTRRLVAEIDAGEHQAWVRCSPGYEDALAAARAVAPRLAPALETSALAAVARGDRAAHQVARQLGRSPATSERALADTDLLPPAD